MDPSVLAAWIGAGGAVVGAAVASPVAVAVLSRRQRAAHAEQLQAQAAEHRAQAEQLQAQAAASRQDFYQELTSDLRAELGRVKADLAAASASLRQTSAEAERLRVRVLELESRVAQLSANEQHLAAELRAAQTERDQLRIQLAGKDATIVALQQQIGDLKAQAALLQSPTQPAI